MHSQSPFSESSGISLLWGFLATQPFPNRRKSANLRQQTEGNRMSSDALTRGVVLAAIVDLISGCAVVAGTIYIAAHCLALAGS
jgi:hypothetical protein